MRQSTQYALQTHVSSFRLATYQAGFCRPSRADINSGSGNAIGSGCALTARQGDEVEQHPLSYKASSVVRVPHPGEADPNG